MVKSSTGGVYLRVFNFFFFFFFDKRIEYSVRLVEKTETGDVYGIDTISLDILEKEGATLLGVAEEDGFSMSTATPSSLSSIEPFIGICNTVEAVYN